MRNRVGTALTTITLTLAASAAPLLATAGDAIAKPAAHSTTRHHAASKAACKRYVRRHHGTRCTVRHNVKAHAASAPKRRSATSAPTAPSSAPSTISITHVPTWAYDDGCNGGTSASSSLVQDWVTYAESNCGPNAPKAASDCHAAGGPTCTAVAYVDANKIYADSAPVAQAAQESWWQHQPGFSDKSHRLSIPDFGGGQLLNQANPAVRSWYQHYVGSSFNSYDGLMMDDTSPGLGAELWGTGSSASQEISSDADLEAAHAQTAQAMTHADGTPFMQVDNALTVNPYLPTPFKMLGDPSSVQGLIAEGVPMDNGTMVGYYSTMLDDLAYVDHTANDFIALMSYDPSGSLQSRRVQAASELLGYSGGHTVSWSDLEQNSNNLAVFPEEGIVPTDPIQSMAAPSGTGCLAGTGQVCSNGGHNDVQVAPGIYRREFKACYDNGTKFGACAALVNTTGSPVTVQSTWLTQTYTHQVTLNGGDVQSGGTVSLTGANFTPGATSIPANDATLLTSAS